MKNHVPPFSIEKSFSRKTKSTEKLRENTAKQKEKTNSEKNFTSFLKAQSTREKLKEKAHYDSLLTFLKTTRKNLSYT